MLKLTKKSDYGLIALRHLAADPSKQTATAKEIADAYHIPPPLLAKVLQKLTKDGFLRTHPGLTVPGEKGGTLDGFFIARFQRP